MMQLEFSLHVPKPCPKERPEHCRRVLDKLEAAGSRGVSVEDFPINFALRSRISNLRRDGYQITTIEGRNGVLTRYVLLQG